MKKILTIGICLFCIQIAAAQEATLFSGKMTHGGYGASQLRISQLNGETAILTGWRGAWIANKTFVLGWSNIELISDDNTAPVLLDGQPGTVDMEYRGPLIGLIIGSDRLVHFTVDAVIGWGKVHYRLRNEEWDWEEDNFFVFTPELGLEFNIIPWMRLVISGGYRLITDVEMDGLTGRDLSGFTGGVTLKFGKF